MGVSTLKQQSQTAAIRNLIGRAARAMGESESVVQDLVCPQLPHARREHAPARQRARHDGAGLPSATTAPMLHPTRRVLAVCGDGPFMMNSQELETAARLGLKLVVLILQGDAYGMIRWK
jgi:thiamine pyrophosphate-dependent acetolactate synthase large subunit-like protein